MTLELEAGMNVQCKSLDFFLDEVNTGPKRFYKYIEVCAFLLWETDSLVINNGEHDWEALRRRRSRKNSSGIFIEFPRGFF